MSDRMLLRGGYVLSMDERVGELPVGDVLIEDGAIAAVAEHARVRGRRGRSTSRPRGHARASSTRTGTPGRRRFGACAPTGRWRTTSAESACRSRPTARPRTCMRATTWARSKRSRPASRRSSTSPTATTRPSTPTRALQGLRDAGIRAMFAYGYYPAPAAEPAFAEHEQRLADARRIREQQLAVRRRARDDGRGADRGRAAAVRADDRRGALGARAGRAERAPHRLQLGLAAHRGDTRARPPRAARAPIRCTCTATRSTSATFRRLAEQRLQGLLQPGDRDPDGHGPPGDRPRARARDAPEPVLRRDVLELGRHVQPDADRPAVRALHAQRRVQRAQPDARARST